ncbi:MULTISPECIES: YueH family protein [Jeotgalicoccus]|uniref:YueH family protein n=1 Tax=Jeotgalicoccus TaxID=227979 RepID=UPI0004797723|nr:MULTISPECIES: YueH family protein [Jeotgalicoccus]QQD85894.1 hypothetical protein JEM45_04520 [Jeotgalicoccus sp. ATCC 8456]
MKKHSIKINDVTMSVYVALDEMNYIVSIPDLSFAMKIAKGMTTNEVEQEAMLHLFSFMDERESSEIANEIGLAIGKI